MLMRSETPRSLEQIERIDQKYLRKAERKEKIYPRVLSALTATAILGSLYWVDARQHEAIQATATIDIDVVGDPLHIVNNDSALVFLDGFGTYDADVTAEHLGPVAQQIVDGELWSVSYGNAPLNPRSISNQVIKLAEERDVDRVSIVGYSAGGIIGIEVAEDIIESSELQVEMIMPISTPDGTDGLRQARQGEMSVLDVVSHVPGAKYSSFVRFMGEMYFRRDQYEDKGFLNVAGDVLGDLGKKQLPGMWLMADQALAIENADLKNRLSHIAESSEIGQRPPIVYFGTEKPGYDYMVNNKKSSENICTYATEVDLQCFIYNVPGAVHTRPWLANDEYMKVARDAAPEVQFAIANELSLLVMKQLEQPKHIG